jgi:hypothetical protein
LDDYVKRIYEVPDSWTDNNLAALKAQAIAARSYALAYTNNGQGTICPTDQCQVFKTDPKGRKLGFGRKPNCGTSYGSGWKSLLKLGFRQLTEGMFILHPISAGQEHLGQKMRRTHQVLIGSFSDLNSNAYDKDSPWFYCDWGSRRLYNGTAWLQTSEVADIVNVLAFGAKRFKHCKPPCIKPIKQIQPEPTRGTLLG